MPDWFNDGSRSFTISSHVFLRAILLMFCQNKWWEIMIIRIANLREIFTHKSISRQECDIWLKLPYLDSGGRLNALKFFLKQFFCHAQSTLTKRTRFHSFKVKKLMIDEHTCGGEDKQKMIFFLMTHNSVIWYFLAKPNLWKNLAFMLFVFNHFKPSRPLIK